MSLLQRVFGRPGAAAGPATVSPTTRQPGAGGASTRGGANSPQAVRKELVRISAKEMLTHNGIPTDWIRIEPLTMSSPNREPGVHVRLVLLHWDPRLMVHAVALQHNLDRRIQALDPQAPQWLMGISWQFDLQDDSACPPLPHPGSWTAPKPEEGFATTFAGVGQRPVVEDGNADVIAGPTRIAGAADDKRRELERLLAERDASYEPPGDSAGFEKTQPMKL